MAIKVPAKGYLGFFNAPPAQPPVDGQPSYDDYLSGLGGGNAGGVQPQPPQAPPAAPQGQGGQQAEDHTNDYTVQDFMAFGLSPAQAAAAKAYWDRVESRQFQEVSAFPNDPKPKSVFVGDPRNAFTIGNQYTDPKATFTQPTPDFNSNAFNLTPAQAQIAAGAWQQYKAVNPPGTVLNPFDIADWASKQTGGPAPLPAPNGPTQTINGVIYGWNPDSQQYDRRMGEAPQVPEPQKTFPLPQGWTPKWTDANGYTWTWDEKKGDYNQTGFTAPPKPPNTQLVQMGNDWVLINTDTGAEIKRYPVSPDAKNRRTQALQVGNDWQIVDLDSGQVLSVIKGPSPNDQADQEAARRQGLTAAIQTGMFGKVGNSGYQYNQPDYSGFAGTNPQTGATYFGAVPPQSFTQQASAFRAGMGMNFYDTKSASGDTNRIFAGAIDPVTGKPVVPPSGTQPQQAFFQPGELPQEPTSGQWFAMSPDAQKTWMDIAKSFGVTTNPADREQQSFNFIQAQQPHGGLPPSSGYGAGLWAAANERKPSPVDVVSSMYKPTRYFR